MAGGRRIHRASRIERLHDCDVCVRGFKSKANLTKHLLKHALKCQRKLQVVQREVDRSTEISTQFVLAPFVRKKSRKRSKRLKSSSWETSNNEPTKVASPGGMYECTFCKLIFSNEDELDNHMNEHPLEAAYKCTVCGYYFRTNEDLSKHVALHNEDEQYKSERKESLLTAEWEVHSSSHVCNICERTFDNLSALSRHLKSHNRKRRYKCDICDQAFVSPLRLTHHSYTHTGNWPIDCEVCGKGFARESMRSAHMNVHSGNKEVFPCKFCEESFEDRASYLRHVKQHKDKRYNCTICNRSYSQEDTLKRHIKTHAGRYTCRCSLCGKGFISKYRLKRHLPIHTRQRVQHVCTVCGKRFLSAKEVKRHAKQHEKLYHCEICKSGRTTKAALIRHMQEKHFDDLLKEPESLNVEGDANTHTGSPQVAKLSAKEEIRAKLLTCFECSLCSKVYLDRESCEKHLEMHNPRSIMCDLCSKSFVSESERSTHMNTAHSLLKSADSLLLGLLGGVGDDRKDDQAIHNRSRREASDAARVLVLRAGTGEHPKQLRECNVCGQMFKRNVGLMVEHLKRHTESDWPPKCDICGQTFKTKKELPPHKATHTNEWPFRCDQCDRGFFFKSKFDRHMLIHGDEKAFKCDVCDKGFHVISDLKKHAMKHTDLRPFQCDQCGKTFREKGHLKRHIGTQHGNDRSSISSSAKTKRGKTNQTPCAEPSVPVDAQITPSGKVFYPCNVCLDAFTTKASFVKHMKTHPSEEQVAAVVTQQYLNM